MLFLPTYIFILAKMLPYFRKSKKKMLNKYTAFYVPKYPQPKCWFEIYATIGQFGTIVDCREETANVVFTLQETEKTDELRRKLECGNMSIPVKECFNSNRYTENIEHTQQPPASDVAPTSIEELNDDILWEIFRLRALDEDDLLTIAQTSDRLSALAKQAFKARYHNKLTIRRTRSIQHYDAVLRLFGAPITSIDFDAECVFSTVFADIVVGLIGYHCRNIRRLKCASVASIGTAYERVRCRQLNGTKEAMPFGQLQSLEYVDPMIDKYYNHKPRAIPVLQLPSLVDLHIASRYVVVTSETSEFFASHQHIKRLTLGLHNLNVHWGGTLLPPDLEELHLSGNPGKRYFNFGYFGRLKHLKAIEFSSMRDGHVNWILVAICNGRVQLERLKITRCETLPAVVGSINSLKYIDCEIGMKGLPEASLTRILRVCTASTNLEEIRVNLGQYIKFDSIRHFLEVAPDTVKAAEFKVHVWSVMPENDTLATINHMIQSGGIDVHVTLTVAVNDLKAVKEKFHQFSDWLAIEDYSVVFKEKVRQHRQSVQSTNFR